ncbi:hypothetical protein A3G67_03525 [Candidatus Roizmanbacteria bacterium RIFCSPLOWO2_12_FULL_40_12]|uniref:Type II secretion system protein GspG C-terminal domain-containing protein n=1 Tax=Candidatus Roizmanbacteria bacterium RIFCSPLOWO2_01_FULL_40_42 TaxID=1802066 RepID=A0A1F7J5L0_9BACT|nr:MAG: hypothetical protein A2779_03160 [Candidatus Roizmanbacteria bacterium RIFCSPHIGHO2_01_FULL_40_98]OGK28338.1 MAG: hypothetical protein A3C31_00525 [Candidatus Roizmanbacteria bacterium RIFCSPHIGHO2_02_FULL_40_53]OGK30574.1 MAG: hypothetical protein A2W49_03210 [Candidatus Roizmanbacteria bacterium RIFCSPHIGHO2_12_41_18]OGK36988.1 MAG: hypothetical protein A3E69_00785 [Candidatus Roizmanbacteria bacterium RIFCSPHIGHO2_12_FULL_40_130]OGK50894.1 MAG: hypothetical protein A3B50_01295 [Candi
MKKGSFGFTLIELLIVIALLGALAIGLLAALDPFEQLKKGTDTGTRNTANEFHGSVIRYYAIKSQMPWCADATCTTVLNSVSDTTPVTLTSATSGTPNTIQNVVDTGELKKDFVNLAGGQLANIWITGDNNTQTIRVCFKPTAKSFRADPNTKYDKNGVLASAGTGITCPDAANAAAECYYCIQ